MEAPSFRQRRKGEEFRVKKMDLAPESHAPAAVGTRSKDLGQEHAAGRGSSFEPSIAVSREDPGGLGDVLEASSNLRFNGKEYYGSLISMEKASSLSCYPFMNHAYFSFQSRNTNGFGPTVTLQRHGHAIKQWSPQQWSSQPIQNFAVP